MLIKILGSWKDDAQKHVDVDLSKRKFMGHSVVAGTTYLTLPFLYTLFKSDPALAAAACQASNSSLAIANCGMITIEAAGGYGPSMMIAPVDKATGLPVDMTVQNRAIGKWPSMLTGAASPLQGVAMNPNDAFTRLLKDVTGTGATTTVAAGFQNRFPGLTQARMNQILTRVKASVAMKASNDDSSSNMFNMDGLTDQFVKASLIDHIGFARSKNYNGTFGGYPAIAMPGNLTQLTNAVGIGNNTLSNVNYGNRIVDAAQKLAGLQAPGLSKNAQASAIIEKVNCGMNSAPLSYDSTRGNTLLDPYTVNGGSYSGVLNLASPNSTTANPINNVNSLATDPVIDPNANATATQYARLAAYQAVVTGRVSSAYLVMGGADYHNGQSAEDMNSVNQTFHAALAVEVITALVAANVNGKDLYLRIVTDGGMNWNSASGVPIAQGDRGSACFAVDIFYKHSGNLSTQPIGGINMVNQSETADSASLIGQLPAGYAFSQAVNWGAMALSPADFVKLKQHLQMIAGKDVSALQAVSIV